MTGTLASIHVHPVKSCGAVSLDRVEITSRGLQGDRLFQVVDADGNAVTQRQQPELATVRPTLDEAGLTLEAPGFSALSVDVPTVNDTTVSSLLGVPVEAGDAGDEAAAWFSDLLGASVRLVAMTDGSEYVLPIPGVEMSLSWADAASVLIANAASLDWLVERAEEPFGMDRFRANLVVTGVDPWVEDTWRDVSIGAARFGHGLAWPRCAIPQVDQVDGSRHKEPAKVLKAHRWCSDASGAPEQLRPLFEGNALFGIGCSVEPAGALISVGDPVTVHEYGSPLIAPPA